MANYNTEKDVAPDDVFAVMNVVDTYIRHRAYCSKDDRSYDHYHPSELGKCLRKQQYKHYAWKKIITIDSYVDDSLKQRLFDKGHNMHNRWSSYFDEIGGVLKGRWKCNNKLCNLFDDKGVPEKKKINEIHEIINSGNSRIYSDKKPIFRPEKCVCGCTDFEYLESVVSAPDLNIKGNADIVLNFDNLKEEQFEGVRITYNYKYLPVDGKIIVIDMKTIGDNQWKRQLEAKGAHKEYIIQITIYVHILGCEYGVIAYENKNDSNMKWFKVPRNDRWWSIISEQMKKMIEMSNSDIKLLPPPKYNLKNRNYKCKFCEFKSICFKSSIWESKSLARKQNDFYKDLLFD